MKKLTFEPTYGYLIGLKSMPTYLYLFFEYTQNDKPFWRLTSRVAKIRLQSKSTIFQTQNSLYQLTTTKFTQVQLSLNEFLLCKQGYTPVEAQALTQLKAYSVTQ